MHVLTQRVPNWIGRFRNLSHPHWLPCICGCRKQLHVNSFMSFISIASGGFVVIVATFLSSILPGNETKETEKPSVSRSEARVCRQTHGKRFKMPSMRQTLQITFVIIFPLPFYLLLLFLSVCFIFVNLECDNECGRR